MCWISSNALFQGNVVVSFTVTLLRLRDYNILEDYIYFKWASSMCTFGLSDVGGGYFLQAEEALIVQVLMI